ncbi:type VI secretion system lipoprotein TssJ [Intestinirhabdus alba]|jgi:type VI secretion system protein VasD|uniref:Type VI secretion system lipoprotein TssJ n=1 Tax=Intestinirhabdus alba TaxID=2899544 RepID=A0A6L6IKP1_9ENTR|nr:type VI secretion system lipoprotein TssJ [Intestinirhabdus alba]MTH46705.1 type VI secretion system lipoprotein TssJ [Intestinirhabdus alba]
MFSKRGIRQYYPRVLKSLLVFLLAGFLFSCSSPGEYKPAPGEIKINLFADSDVNPNEQGEPAPLYVFIYNVKEPDVFNNADFFEIINDNSKPLQAAASKIYEAILQPGEQRSVLIRPDGEIGTLGFIGAYRNLNDSVWMMNWTFPKKKRAWWQRIFSNDAPELNAWFQKTAITIKKVD